MDINKILFEQLNLQGIQTPFTVDGIDGSDAVQKESVGENNELKKEISSALNVEDEASSLQIGNKKSSAKLNSAVLNTQNLMNMLSNETQRYNKEEKEIEKEIQSKDEEYQKLAEEIQAKQEEYEKLANEAESGNDPSVIERANFLGEEIKLITSDLESIKKSIDNLQTELKSKQSIVNTLNNQMNSLSKVQSKISKEAITMQGVTTADKVDNNSSEKLTEKNEAAKAITWTVPDRVKQEFEGLKGEPYHSNHSYNEILGGKCKLTSWEYCKFADSGLINSFKELNAIPDEVDIDGDGQISADEKYYMKNYKLQAYAVLHAPINRNSDTMNTIEEQIERLEFLENNPEISEITQAYVDMYKNDSDMIGHAYKEQKIQQKYGFSVDIGVMVSGVDQTLNQVDMQRYWKDASYQQQTENLSGDARKDYQANIQAQADRNNPLNIYKNYLLENELSQEEYQNIINKINNCTSEDIKAKLSDILSIAQGKIAK